ncbi:MAG: oligopeptide/dipeptide ABC transporter ATP-binding protein [Mesotoga infera]
MSKIPDSKLLLRADRLVKHFPVRAGVFRRVVAQVKAVDDISFDVYEKETLGLVGESGCGKTTAGMSVLRLYEPTSGRIIMEGEDTTHYFMPTLKAKKYIRDTYIDRFVELKGKGGSSEAAIQSFQNDFDRKIAERYFKEFNEDRNAFMRSMLSNREEKRKAFRRNAQIIFQDPFSSLNPRMRIKNIIGEGARIHGLATGSDVLDKVADIMTKVGLSKDHMSRFPHEFSGGQRQRIGVARALILNPKLIVCDEAVSALDVSIQAQILNLLNDLQKEFGLTYLFIAHDLGVVKHISKRVAVMYLGKVAELSDKKKLFDDPLHPYTVSLMSAIPEANPEKKKQRIILQGDVPSPINPPFGCRFHPRCPIAKEVCSREEPQLQDVGGGHFVSCFFPGQLKR